MVFDDPPGGKLVGSLSADDSDDLVDVGLPLADLTFSGFAELLRERKVQRYEACSDENLQALLATLRRRVNLNIA